jgi:hypothetical protein
MFPVILRREIIVALAAKAGLLTLLYFLFFSPSHHPPEPDTAMQAHIFGPR